MAAVTAVAAAARSVPNEHGNGSAAAAAAAVAATARALLNEHGSAVREDIDELADEVGVAGVRGDLQLRRHIPEDVDRRGQRRRGVAEYVLKTRDLSLADKKNANGTT